MRLLTIGYEGMSQEDFFLLLKSNNVQRIIDVRELAISRKAGFSKSALIKKSSELGIGYFHIPELGSPSDIRHNYKEDDDWKKFSALYRKHLEGQKSALDALMNQVKETTCCLLCFEANPLQCHRSIVANYVLSRIDEPLSISHLRSIGLKQAVPVRFLQPSPLGDR